MIRKGQNSLAWTTIATLASSIYSFSDTLLKHAFYLQLFCNTMTEVQDEQSSIASNTSPILIYEAHNKSTSYLQTLFNLTEKKAAPGRHDFALQLGGLVLPLPVQCRPRSVEGQRSILQHRQKFINLTALGSVIPVARDNMPVRCLHRRPSNNSAKKLHGQHNLQQLRRCSNIYQGTA